MDVVTDLRALSTPPTLPIMTIGNFDGVHLGHQAIFRSLIERAQAVGGTSLVLTFDPHPLKVLAPERCPPLLTPTAKKLSLLRTCDVDLVVCLPFTIALANLTPVAFGEDILVRTLGVHEIHVGYDFAFGRGRQGTISLLDQLGAQHNFQVHMVEPIAIEGKVVSSSLIRQWLQAGAVETAARFLGRLYSIQGRVVEGYRKGRELGFPTANIRSEAELIPDRGVYAVVLEWHGTRYDAVANIGYNPTFGRTQLSVEVHILDFAQELYDETVEVFFVKKIRDERPFPSIAELIAQIGHDVQTAQTVLSVYRAQASPYGP
jgi:riboflavin kinase/FMN adenylyltransferase